MYKRHMEGLPCTGHMYLECLISLETLVRPPMEVLTRPYIFGRLQEVVFFKERPQAKFGRSQNFEA